MGERSLAAIIGGPEIRARHLQEAHKQAYPTLYRWLDAAADKAMLSGYIDSVFGYRLNIEGDGIRRGTLLNFPCQANGAEMLRLACIGATEAGLSICAPVHDALLLEADTADIHEHVEALRAIMESAAREVLGGFTVRTDAEIVYAPARYADPRGAVMWSRVMSLLDQPERAEATAYNPNPAPAALGENNAQSPIA
jgi:DNA polymerase I-like protein with 3'-5' exonuclease and polymerase domains